MFKAIYRFARLTGMDPFAFRHLGYLWRYFREMRQFKQQGGAIGALFPVLSDYADNSGVAAGHYFHQDLIIAQSIFDKAPDRHLDIGSRVDGFVAHVAAFREIQVLDIRPLNNAAHCNIKFVQADLMKPMPDMVEAYDSVSCLHALEHFGLGRYTDSIDVYGHLKGFAAITSLVTSGGYLYLSVPVGRGRVEFNAHRIFDPAEPLAWAEGVFDLAQFDYVDDAEQLHRYAAIDNARALNFGLGIYYFIKR